MKGGYPGRVRIAAASRAACRGFLGAVHICISYTYTYMYIIYIHVYIYIYIYIHININIHILSSLPAANKHVFLAARRKESQGQVVT